MSASTFHPWVWEAHAPCGAAATIGRQSGLQRGAINAQAQTKLNRRDASDGNLLADAFSTNAPIQGHPRFRLMPDDASETFRSLHNGAASFARGVYSAIRNPTAHEEGELEEIIGLEQLAVFSVLARWVDAAEVDR
jgi:hypothetical protein